MSKYSGDSVFENIGRIIISEVCKTVGEDHRHAIEKGVERCLEEIVIEYGGISVYLPKGTLIRCSAEAKKIIADFNGKNYRELAKKYGKTEMRIRQITKSSRSNNSNNHLSIKNKGIHHA